MTHRRGGKGAKGAKHHAPREREEKHMPGAQERAPSFEMIDGAVEARYKKHKRQHGSLEA